MVAAIAMVALASPVILERGHSHNDYTRRRPLDEALEAGLNSVEVDVFLVDGKLLVAHDLKDVSPDRTIESMYLTPLSERISANGGSVHRGAKTPLWVLVDIKSNGIACYESLKSTLKSFPSLRWDLGQRAVRFVISGDRPIAAIIADKGKFAGLDGRWPDIGKGIPSDVMPLVSEAWLTHFKWIGAGSFPVDQRAKLNNMVSTAHKDGRRIRFWGAPDSRAIWQTQWDSGVDFINTDRPTALRDWMLPLLPPTSKGTWRGSHAREFGDEIAGLGERIR